MQITFQVGTIIAFIATIVSAIVSAIVTKKVASDKRVIEIITSNRVSWIKETRDLFSQYITYTKYYSLKGVPTNKNKWLESLYELTNKIRLQLNPKGEKDKQILKQIEELNKSYEKLFMTSSLNLSKEQIKLYLSAYKDIYREMEGICNREREQGKVDFKDSKEYFSMAAYIIDLDRKLAIQNIKFLSDLIEIYNKIYLKCEWERVKLEAKKGIKCKYDFDKEFESIEKVLDKEIKYIKDEIKENQGKMIAQSTEYIKNISKQV